MLDRRKLMSLGLGAGLSLAAPLSAAAGTHRLVRAKAGHAAAHHAKAGRLLHLASAHHGRHGPPPLALRHEVLHPQLEKVLLGPRSITLKNLHTDETLEAVYWDDGKYVPDALEAVNKVLRDFRTGEVHPIEPQLLDLITDVRARLGSNAPFQVISGYRSPQTNAMLREQSADVAQHSLHMDGKAIDIFLEGVDLDMVRRAGLSLGRGGVGYYPGRFVHLDVGPVRHWQAA